MWLADLAASCLRSRSDLVGLSGSAQSTAQLRARRTAAGAKAAISEQIQQIRRTGYPAHSLHCQDKTKVKGGRHQHGSRRSTPATPPDFGSPCLHRWLQPGAPPVEFPAAVPWHGNDQAASALQPWLPPTPGFEPSSSFLAHPSSTSTGLSKSAGGAILLPRNPSRLDPLPVISLSKPPPCASPPYFPWSYSYRTGVAGWHTSPAGSGRQSSLAEKRPNPDYDFLMQALDLRGQCEARLGEWVAMDYPADGDELGEVAIYVCTICHF